MVTTEKSEARPSRRPADHPDGLALAGVGAVTLLAATGSDLLVPGLALALLLLAAGVVFVIRPRTARS